MLECGDGDQGPGFPVTGLGAAGARALLKAGSRVVLADLNRETGCRTRRHPHGAANNLYFGSAIDQKGTSVPFYLHVPNSLLSLRPADSR